MPTFFGTQADGLPRKRRVLRYRLDLETISFNDGVLAGNPTFLGKWVGDGWLF